MKTVLVLLGWLLWAAPMVHAAPDALSVVYGIDEAPYQFKDSQGNAAGLGIDIWKLWSQKTGIPIKFIPAPWDETLNIMREGKADAHVGLYYSEKRDTYLDYGAPYLKADTYVFYHESLPQISSTEELLPYRIGVVTGDYVQEFLEENVPGITLATYASYDEIMVDLKSGRLKAFASEATTALAVLREHGLDKQFQYRASKPLYQKGTHVAVQQGDSKTLGLIAEGMAQITEKERVAIVRKWLRGGKAGADGSLVIAIDRNYPPLYFIGENGKPKGLLVDVWKEWARKTNKQIDFRPSDWPGTLEALETGEADIHGGLLWNEERAQWIDFSSPVYETAAGLFFKSGSDIVSLQKLAGKKVGTIPNTYHESFIRDKYPDLEIVPVADTDALVLGLMKGAIDAAVDDILSVEAVLNSFGLQDAIVRYPESVFTGKYFGGVVKDRTELLQLVNDGLKSFSNAELASIEARWISKEEDRYYKGEEDQDIVALTEEEKQWIASHVVKIGVEEWAPVVFMGKEGRIDGIVGDSLNLLAQRTGLQFEPVIDTWDNLINSFRERTIDLLPDAYYTDERATFGLFSKPYFMSKEFIYVRSDNKQIHSLDDLAKSKIAVVKGYGTIPKLKKALPDATIIETKNLLVSINAILNGEVDAIFETQVVMQQTLLDNSISGIKGVSQNIFPASPIHFMSRIDEPLLQSIIQKGLDSISATERRAIQKKWLSGDVGEDEISIELTSDERQWLAKHPQIRIAATPDWPPFEFDEDGKHVGFAADVLSLVAKRTGMELVPQFNSWDAVMAKVKSGELDFSPGMVKTPAREKEYLFTEPYFDSRMAIWVESSLQGISSMADLRGKTVAVEEGYSTHERVAELYPDIKLHLVKSSMDAVLAVSSGKVDAYLGILAATQYLMKENVITNLKVSGYFNEATLDLRMGVNRKNQILVDILNKGLASITTKEKKKLLEKYVGSAASESSARKQVVLTDEEKEWIADHKSIRLGVDPAWAPFEYLLGVTHSGLSAEYVKLLSKETGLSFAPPPILNWADVVRLSQEKKLDVLPAVAQTPEREQHLSFSKPYGSFPIVIYQRTNAQTLKNMGMLDGKSVAVVTGYAIAELLKDNHSDIKLVEFRNLDMAVKALSDGQVEGLAGNMVAVEYAKQQTSVFNIAPAIKTPYVQELRFGVRQDWGPLVRIIDKWLATIDESTHESMAQAVGVNLDTPDVEEGTEEPVDFTQLMLIGGGIILVFGISLIILIFLRRFVQSRAEALYSSHQYKIVGIVVGILFLCLVVVATWYALSQLENRARQGVGEALESVLLTTHEALSIWEQQNKKYVEQLVESPVLKGLTRGLLSLPKDRATIESSPQLWNLRKFMKRLQPSMGFVEYSVVSKDLLSYGATNNDDLLEMNSITLQRTHALDKVFLGSTFFIPPIKIVGGHEGVTDEGYSTLVSIAAPLKGGDGNVFAVLILYFDATEAFQRIIAMGRMGNTGETYAFDKNGNLVSESRFDGQLQPLGLVGEKQSGILSLRISDPGGNLVEGYALNTEEVMPLTVSVQSATLGNSGIDLGGYRDYRGVPVIGAWLWNDSLGLGLVTEMDMDEALGSYRLVRNTVIAIILITILLGTIMTGLSNWIGQSAAKSLSKAKDELEDRVEERTAELKKISVAVEKSPASVVITDPKGVIEYVNPTFSLITGYSAEEAIGLNPKVLKSGIHPKEFYKEMWGTILQGSVWIGDILNKKKGGELFWERTSIAPIFNDDNVLTHFVAVKEDITHRKAQEERFQALLDSAPDAMVIIARSGEITLVNLATEELFGYGRDELIGQKVEILLPDYIRSNHPSHRDRFFATPGDLSLVAGKAFFGQTKAGEEVPVDISLNPIETEDGVQIIASIRDITERKKAEEALRRSEERFRSYFEHAQVGMSVTHPDKGWLEVNPAQQEILGYTLEELRELKWSEMTHPDDLEADVVLFEKMFAGEIDHYSMEKRYFRKDGELVYTDLSVACLRDDDGKVSLVLASILDITKRKKMELELMDALAVVTSSIQYASRIQRSVLPLEGMIEKFTSDYFVVWEPRDVVGGDLYWSEPWGRGHFIMLGDCTGHGVPGAFMTLISSGALERALLEVPPGDSARLVSRMHQMIQTQLGQHREDVDNVGSDDGLELGICYVHPKRKKVIFAGARMPLFVDNGESIETIKSDKKGIGYRGIPFNFEYTNHEIEVTENLRFFMTTDGIIDQVGGERRRGFGKKRFLALLESLRGTPLQSQGDKIYAELVSYQGDEKRRDDVSFVGFKL
ncbi:transporter substrate-binding domain-containing protein [Pseudodesulfovibrio sp.]|nr:transporter substrate-binding domain-containing protein [Pseudodesulfovibrio sp.]